ncbi:hypothetical protein [Mycobacterium sp. E1386]|nr:hypothetical protein [Mycobacterium sp. E1386]
MTWHRLVMETSEKGGAARSLGEPALAALIQDDVVAGAALYRQPPRP